MPLKTAPSRWTTDREPTPKSLSRQQADPLLKGSNQTGDGEHCVPAGVVARVREAAERPFQLYDFKRPRLFSQSQIQVFSQIHDAFARDFSGYLSAQLRTPVDITLAATEQIVYAEYVAASALPAALYVIQAEGHQHQAVFELEPRLVIYAVEKLFGGTGAFLQQPRAVSQIEQCIMRRVITRALQKLGKAWEPVAEIKLSEKGFESSAEFAAIASDAEPVLVSSFEVKVHDQRSFIKICYPYLLLKHIIGGKGRRREITGAIADVPDPVRQRYEDTLRGTKAELRAELGRTRLPVQELMQLQPGDVIPLEQRTRDAIPVYVGEQERFRAAAGVSGRRRALRILDTVKPPKTDAPDDQ